MERDYMDVWCNQLSMAHRTMEEETNIRGPDFNTEEVVEKYRAHEELVIQKKKAKAWDTMRKQLEQRSKKKKKGKTETEGRPWDTMTKSRNVTSVLKRAGVSTRCINNFHFISVVIRCLGLLCYSTLMFHPRASKRLEAAEASAPYKKNGGRLRDSVPDEDFPSDPRSSDFSVDRWGQPANWPRSWRPKVVRGIPEWALAKNYIEYRKCKYIEDIRYVPEVHILHEIDSNRVSPLSCFFPGLFARS